MLPVRREEPDHGRADVRPRPAPALIWAQVDGEPDGMDREQRGSSRPPHNVHRASPCRCRPAGRPRAQPGQSGQHGHHAGCQFQAQQRRRNRAESPRDATGHHRSIPDSKPAAGRLRHHGSPYAPAADGEPRKRISTGAQPKNDSSGGAPHDTGCAPRDRPGSSLPQRHWPLGRHAITRQQSHGGAPEHRDQGPMNFRIARGQSQPGPQVRLRVSLIVTEACSSPWLTIFPDRAIGPARPHHGRPDDPGRTWLSNRISYN